MGFFTCSFFGLPFYYQILVLLGLSPFITLIAKLVRFVQRSQNVPNLKKYGEWAVVTGATDGIGQAYAEEIAKQGVNVFLISRSEAKLQTVEAELKGKFPKVEFKHIEFDFSQSESIKTVLGPVLKDLNIGILINNVGMSYPYPEYLADIPDDLATALIAINVTSLTVLTKLVLPGMTQRNKGYIANIGSAAGVISAGSPLLAVYSGTKAYVDFFSRSLAVELAGKGIHVQCHVPYFVTSKLSKIRKSSFTVPDPKGYAKAAINAIGDPTSSVVPYWTHSVQHLIVQALPLTLAAKYITDLHLAIRKAALKKKG